jgi:hypothetical protein
MIELDKRIEKEKTIFLYGHAITDKINQLHTLRDEKKKVGKICMGGNTCLMKLMDSTEYIKLSSDTIYDTICSRISEIENWFESKGLYDLNKEEI